MTTYTISGIYINYGPTSAQDIFQPATIALSTEPGVNSFSYFHSGTTEFGAPIANVNGLFQTLWPFIEGGQRPIVYEQSEAVVVDIAWTYEGVSGFSTILSIDDLNSAFGEYYFFIGGTPMPGSIDNGVEWDQFGASITSINFSAASPFAAGQSIPLAGLLNVTITEMDTIYGTIGDDDISSGIDDDLIFGLGGSDTLRGGDGDDWLQFESPEQGSEAHGGAGIDTLSIREREGGGAAALVVNYADGPSNNQLIITGRSDHTVDAIQYWSLSGFEIERVSLNYIGDILVLGDAADNYIALQDLRGLNFMELQGGAGTDTLDLRTTFVYDEIGSSMAGMSSTRFDASTTLSGSVSGVEVRSASNGRLLARLTDWEEIRFSDGTFTIAELLRLDSATDTPTSGDDTLFGTPGADRLAGLEGNDWIEGRDGADTLNGGTGDDFLFGGATDADLRDLMFGGDGNDSMDGGAGNDEMHGGSGIDTVVGGLGSDTLIGNDGDDVIVGSGGSDAVFGNAGRDFINGGFGYDRLNGGADADSFFHQGVAGHGSDWIQDYNTAEGDRLVVGISGATRSQFQVNFATTAGAGDAGVGEAFVIYRPTGQILFALVDGAGQSSINISLGGQVFDLLA